METICIIGLLAGVFCVLMAAVGLFEDELAMSGYFSAIGIVLLLLCAPAVKQYADARFKVQQTAIQERIQTLVADKWTVYYTDKEKTILVKDNTILVISSLGDEKINPVDVKLKGVTPAPEKPAVAEKKQ